MSTTYPLTRGNVLECVICHETVKVEHKGQLPDGWMVLMDSGDDLAFCPEHDPIIKQP